MGDVNEIQVAHLYESTPFPAADRAEGGAKIFGVFRVKKHDFTQKNHIFSNLRGPPLNPHLVR